MEEERKIKLEKAARTLSTSSQKDIAESPERALAQNLIDCIEEDRKKIGVKFTNACDKQYEQFSLFLASLFCPKEMQNLQTCFSSQENSAQNRLAFQSQCNTEKDLLTNCYFSILDFITTSHQS